MLPLALAAWHAWYCAQLTLACQHRCLLLDDSNRHLLPCESETEAVSSE